MADNAPDAPADAPADTPMDGETPPGEEEDEECLDPGQFFRVHKYRATGDKPLNLVRIYKAMVDTKTYKQLPSGRDTEKAQGLVELMKSDTGLELRILRHRRDKVKRFNAKYRAEQEESSSDDESAPLAVGERVLMGERPGVIAALPESKFSPWWKLRLDGEEENRNVRRGQFSRMDEQPAPRRRSEREGAGELKEERTRCNQCDACVSMLRPPPGCTCGKCQGKSPGTCEKVTLAREHAPKCAKWAKDDEPEIGEDESATAKCGDPTTREFGKLGDVAERIRDEKPAGGDIGGQVWRHAAAVLSLAVPGMPQQVFYVLQLLGEDATKEDLGEYVAEHLRKCAYLDDDEKTRDEMIRLARAAAIAPDVEPEPPANRSIMHRRAWQRIAKALYRQQRDEILALPKGSAALKTWLRTRAQFAVDSIAEQNAESGALADWKPGLAAAGRALRENMFTEGLKGERYNNDPKHRKARVETGRTDVTDNVPRLRETGPPPQSSRKEKK